MGIRAGRRVAPLAAALLCTLVACAQPSAAPAGAGSTAALLTRTSTVVAAARPSLPAAPTATPTTAPAAAPTTAIAAPPPARPTPPAGIEPVTSGAGRPAAALPSCSAASLRTSVAGTLTFAASAGVGAPWFIGNPDQGRGFEAAVAAAVARQLGYAPGRVQWKRAPAAEVGAANVPGVDVGLGEFRTPDQSGGPVDYSTGYFSISDSVVARAGTPAAGLTGLPALSKLRVATQSQAAGTGRLDSPSSTAYPTVAAALAALRRGAVDVAVVPTPTAVTAGPDIAVLGQLSQPTEQPAQFGMVLAKNSTLTSCVSAAIDQLRVTGALAALVQRWVPAANKPLG